MKVLIIRLSSIGDIVLTTPVIRCIKKQIPESEIHYLIKPVYAAVLEANPYLSKLHYADEDIGTTIARMKNERFDLIIDLHNNFRSFKIKRALKIPAKSFPKLNIRKWVLTTFKIDLLPDEHIVDRYLETVAHLGVVNDGRGLDYFVPVKDQIREEDIPASHLAGYIAIAIGATHNTKKLPLHKLKEICSKLDHPIILLGGDKDRDIGERISAIDKGRVYNACGKFNINESADLVRRSKLLITHDTGLMHIAAAFKRPIISVWGNTVPAFGMYPYFGSIESGKTQPYEIVEVKGLYCRPCSKIGYKRCPLGHFKCMNDIDIAKVEALVYQHLGRKK